jgi:hypothetical protein
MENPANDTPSILKNRLEELEKRMAALEARLAESAAPIRQRTAAAQPAVAPAVAATGGGEDLEFEVGQKWFALVGIAAVVAGFGFLLAQPWAGLPPVAPSLGGALAGAALLLLAERWRGNYELVAKYFSGAGLVVLYFSALRLFFFGQPPALDPGSLAAPVVLLAVAGGIVLWGCRRGSVRLAGLGLLAAAASALAVNTAEVTWAAMLLLAGAAAWLGVRRGWVGLLPAVAAAGPVIYALWMLGGPQAGRAPKLIAEGGVGPLVLLVHSLIIAAGFLWRPDRKAEGPVLGLGVALNLFAGYGVFLAHTAAGYRGSLVVWQLAAFAAQLGLAVAFWLREQSRLATFLYAMTGYLALSVAILKAVKGPAVFVWLSVQSVVVVATAIWFRSRFIVVANFLIYVFIVLAYMVATKVESGISLGFGVVALVSARILNWQQQRLELKTGLMRNAYLVSAFVVFPYALHHLVSGKFVALAWMALALFYYGMNLMVRSPKFRWMGHGTLLLTAVYLAVVGTSRFSPAYRVLSFLVLGLVLLVVSVVFTRIRRRSDAG